MGFIITNQIVAIDGKLLPSLTMVNWDALPWHLKMAIRKKLFGDLIWKFFDIFFWILLPKIWIVWNDQRRQFWITLPCKNDFSNDKNFETDHTLLPSTITFFCVFMQFQYFRLDNSRYNLCKEFINNRIHSVPIRWILKKWLVSSYWLTFWFWKTKCLFRQEKGLTLAYSTSSKTILQHPIEHKSRTSVQMSFEVARIVRG